MTSQHQDRLALAAALVSGGCLIAALQDAAMKWMSGDYPVHQLVFIRGLGALVPIALLTLRYQGVAAIFPAQWKRTLLRAVIIFAANTSFVLAIASMPMADAIAIYFTMPFIAAALSWPMLREHVPWHRWLAIAIGFSGVLVMNGAGPRLYDPGVLFAFFCAAAYALAQVIGRGLSRSVSPLVQSFYQCVFYVIGSLVLAALFFSADTSPSMHKSLAFLAMPWKAMPWREVLLLVFLGFLAAPAMLMFANAYKLGKASFVAPFEYTSIIWAVIAGYLIWGDVPGLRVAAGVAIVVGAGLFMVWAGRAELMPRDSQTSS